MKEDSLTSTHWGTYRVECQNGITSALRGFEEDPNAPPIGDAIIDTFSEPCRVDSPMV